MKDPKVIWAWVGGAIVVVALIVGIVWHFANNGPTGPVAVHAPTGQIVSGFPKELVLDTNIQVSNSYSMNYTATTNQYTAEWAASTTAATTYNDYITYLSQNNWTITNHASSTALYAVYATNASTVLSVYIMPQGTSSKVSITYVVK